MRYVFEEQVRRSMKADADVLSKPQILKILFPDYNKLCDETMALREKEIMAEFN